MAKRLGATIRGLRHALGINQEVAAAAADLSPKHWQDLEAGRSNPTLSSLVAVAQALQVSLSQLFAAETEVFQPPPEAEPSGASET